MCKWCDELNEEKEKITVEEIRLHPSGWYNYHIPIYCCPVCGKRLKKYEGYSIEQILNGCIFE